MRTSTRRSLTWRNSRRNRPQQRHLSNLRSNRRVDCSYSLRRHRSQTRWPMRSARSTRARCPCLTETAELRVSTPRAREAMRIRNKEARAREAPRKRNKEALVMTRSAPKVRIRARRRTRMTHLRQMVKRRVMWMSLPSRLEPPAAALCLVHPNCRRLQRQGRFLRSRSKRGAHSNPRPVCHLKQHLSQSSQAPLFLPVLLHYSHPNLRVQCAMETLISAKKSPPHL